MCGGVLTGLSGVISSPGYPQEYSNNADCSWAIHVSNTSVVTLVFLDFQLENNEGCNFDFVALFDGPTVTHRHLGKYCGADKPPNIVTSSNQLLVVFKSDFNIGGRGFRAYYYSGGFVWCGKGITTIDWIINLCQCLSILNVFVSLRDLNKAFQSHIIFHCEDLYSATFVCKNPIHSPIQNRNAAMKPKGLQSAIHLQKAMKVLLKTESEIVGQEEIMGSIIQPVLAAIRKRTHYPTMKVWNRTCWGLRAWHKRCCHRMKRKLNTSASKSITITEDRGAELILCLTLFVPLTHRKKVPEVKDLEWLSRCLDLNSI